MSVNMVKSWVLIIISTLIILLYRRSGPAETLVSSSDSYEREKNVYKTIYNTLRVGVQY